MPGPRSTRASSSTKPVPRSAGQELVYASSPDDDRRVREGIAASERGEVIELTEEELRHYGETGELPERVERWFASHG